MRWLTRMRQHKQGHMVAVMSSGAGCSCSLLLDSHDLFVSTQHVCFVHMVRLRDVLCVHFARIEIYIRGNDQDIALSLLTLVFRFDVVFHRHFSGRFCRGNEHLWHHVNEEAADFHTLTFQREMGMALDVLCTGYHPCILMYVLDKLFFVFKKLRANDFDAQCMVAYETLQMASCRCMEWCGNEKKKGNTLGDAYLQVDL